MTEKLFGILTLAALVGAVSVPLSAQALHLTATIPFEFSVGNKILPAGDYSVTRDDDTRAEVLLFQNLAIKTGALVVTRSGGDPNGATAGMARLVFHRYGSQYFLSEVWDGHSATARQVPAARSERELARTASANRIEILAMLMPR